MASDDEAKPGDDEAPTAREAPDDPGRRRMLKIGVGVLGGGLAAIPAIPAIGFIAHPLFHTITSTGEGYIAAGPRSQFSATPVKVDLHADLRDAWSVTPRVKIGSCWVLEREAGLCAYTTVCPHLGCAVDFDGEARAFKCPCHRSEFDLDGAPLHGPAPRPLDTLDVDVDRDTKLVSIRYRRFRQGVAEKVEV